MESLLTVERYSCIVLVIMHEIVLLLRGHAEPVIRLLLSCSPAATNQLPPFVFLFILQTIKKSSILIHAIIRKLSLLFTFKSNPRENYKRFLSRSLGSVATFSNGKKNVQDNTRVQEIVSGLRKLAKTLVHFHARATKRILDSFYGEL